MKYAKEIRKQVWIIVIVHQETRIRQNFMVIDTRGWLKLLVRTPSSCLVPVIQGCERCRHIQKQLFDEIYRDSLLQIVYYDYSYALQDEAQGVSSRKYSITMKLRPILYSYSQYTRDSDFSVAKCVCQKVEAETLKIRQIP